MAVTEGKKDSDPISSPDLHGFDFSSCSLPSLFPGTLRPRNPRTSSSMADPFTILGTASSIVSLLELAWKLLAETHSVYRSAGQSGDNIFLSIIADDVSRLNDKIVASPACNADLQDLVQKSRKITEELLEALGELQVKDATVWKSFTVALKEVWKRGKIEAFSARLAKLQTQVASHIQLEILYCALVLYPILFLV